MVNARRKGHSFERWVSNFLKKFFPLSKRHLEYQAQESHKGVDIDNTAPFAIQCKSYKSIAVYNWLEEIDKSKGIPILIAKSDYKKPILIAYLEDVSSLIFDPKFISIYQSEDYSSSKVIRTVDAVDTQE